MLSIYRASDLLPKPSCAGTLSSAVSVNAVHQESDLTAEIFEPFGAHDIESYGRQAFLAAISSSPLP
jgi:hypothetical protein